MFIKFSSYSCFAPGRRTVCYFKWEVYQICIFVVFFYGRSTRVDLVQYINLNKPFVWHLENNDEILEIIIIILINIFLYTECLQVSLNWTQHTMWYLFWETRLLEFPFFKYLKTFLLFLIFRYLQPKQIALLIFQCLAKSTNKNKVPIWTKSWSTHFKHFRNHQWQNR